jgi:hypothetical protein
MTEIAVEHFSESLFGEILPLGKKCWKESTEVKGATCAYYGDRDFEIEPDMAAYKRLESIGALTVVTLREEAKLVGYMVGFTYQSLHHRKILGAVGDTIYIEPEFRSLTGAVAERFENEMRAKGVQIIGWPTHQNGPVYEVLKALGYVGDDIVMEKRLSK